MISNYYPG